MSAKDQKPLGSGFGVKTTAAEVMKGVDLSGKTAIVTGGYSGLGLETTRALVGAGADVVVPARDKARADEIFVNEGLAVETWTMDLADLASVQEFATDVMGGRDQIHLLINNAGVMACPETRVGPDWEMQFAVNHIGHFVLTKELMAYLKNTPGARVACLSSSAHKLSPIIWEDIHFTKNAYDKWKAYGQSKTAVALFALELNRRLADDDVKAFSLHPGGIFTPLQRHTPREEMVALGWIDESGEVTEMAKPHFKTPEQGCATTLWCATSPLLNERGGEYCENCDIAKLGGEDSPPYAEVAPWAVDEEAARRLWDLTEEMVTSV